MWIRRRTLERMLTDRDRAQAADRRELIRALADQSDRILILAGRQPLIDPQPEPAALTDDDDGLFDDVSQDTDDLGTVPY